MNTLFMIGNTHFDPVWLWTWDEAMASIRSTFRAALDRMKEDGDFIYSFGTAPVFEWIRQTDTDMFAEIKERVKEGRWDIKAEGWWLQPDCNAVHGESLVRQGLYGQRYLMEHFNKKARTVFNIDSFGHSAMIPQIMQKCELEYYVFSRPANNEMDLESELFQWCSPDGSKVLAFRSGGLAGGEAYPPDISSSINEIKPSLLAAKHDLMLVYGVTNHGGAPTKATIQAIQAEKAKAEGYKICFARVDSFFSAQEGKLLPSLQGELQTRYYGPFSNHPEVKNNNRRGEYSLMNAEKAAILAKIFCQRSYPLAILQKCWADIMFNQFHDILGGASIKEAFVDARNLHGRSIQTANEITHFSLQSIVKKVNMLGNNEDSPWNLCIFNLNTTPYAGIIEGEVQWAWEFPWYKGGIELVDAKGNIIKTQIVLEKSVIPGFRTRFAFAADIPALGYNVYAVRQTHKSVSKEYSKTDITAPFRPRVYHDAGDTWCFNTRAGYGKAAGDFVLTNAATVEKGALFTTVKRTWQYNNSLFHEYITSYQHNEYIDYRYEVNWNESHKVLKLVFEAEIIPNSIRAAIPYGSLERACDGREYPVGEWLKWQSKNGWVTLLLDGIFAYDTQAKNLRLTLLRSPIYGDLRTEPLDNNADYPYMGQGISTGRIRVYNAKINNAAVTAWATHFNNPPVIICEANHAGALPARFTGLEVTGSAVLVTAIKEAEDGNGTILRMVEYEGKVAEIKFSLLGSLPYETTLSPFEIKTVLFDFAGEGKEVNMLEV